MNVASGQIEPRQPLEIERARLHLRREDAAPDGKPLLIARKRKVYDEAQAPHESRVERAFHVGRENGETSISLHALQKIVDFDVGVAVVRVLDIRALAVERIGFVEEEKRAAVFCRVEQTAQV